MKIEKLQFVKNKISYSGEIVWPSDLKIAIHLLGEKEVWDAFKIGYKELAKRRITGEVIRPRRKVARIELSSLDDQTRAVIEEIVKLQAVQPQQPQVLKTPQPEQQQIIPNDFDETQEESTDLTFAREQMPE